MTFIGSCRCLISEGKRGTFSELTGSMSRAAGKKINRIITFSKKKPPLAGEAPSSSGHHDNPRCGKDSVKKQHNKHSPCIYLVVLCRLPQCVSEWLLEGALVRAARWKPVSAEGPRRPAAAHHHGATQGCRGGARWPRPKTSLLFLHPPVRQ